MPDTVLVDIAYPNPGDVIATMPLVEQSAGTFVSPVARPSVIPAGAAFYVGATGTSAAGRTGQRDWVQYVAAAGAGPVDPGADFVFPQALGTTSPRPSWADDFRGMFGASHNPATIAGDQPAFTPSRTVTLDLSDVGTFTSMSPFNGAWMNYFGNRVGYAGKWQNGDRLIIPQPFLIANDNLDIPPSVTNVEIVLGTTESATVIRHTQITEATGLMDRHAIRVLGAQKIRIRAASKARPAVIETVGAVGRTGLNQQGNTMLLLDPGTADFMAQDLVLRGARAAGFFAYRATRYWLNRCQSIETQADAWHSTNGSSYGLFTDCRSIKSGDDGWACVRYSGEQLASSNHHIAVVRHRVDQTGHGRGFANICCSDIWWDQIYVEGAAASPFLIDREASTATPAVGIYNHLAQRIHVKGGNWSEQDHGSLFLNNGQTNEEVHARIESYLIEDAHPFREVVRAVGGTGPVLEAVLKDVKAIGGPGNINNRNAWFGGNNKSRIVFAPDPIFAETANADTTKPTLVFLAPGIGATVTGTTVRGPVRRDAQGNITGDDLGNTGAYRNSMLAFYAGDNRGGVQSVEVKVGDTVVATVAKANIDGAGRVALQGINWAQFANGAGRITITATDASGNNTGTHTRDVLVSNPTPGTVSPMPAGGAAPADTTPPTAPTNITVTRASGSSTDAAISWTRSTDTGTGVLGYHVYWTPTGGTTTRLNSALVSGTTLNTTGLSTSDGTVAVEALDGASPANVSTRVGVAVAGYTAPTPTPSGGRPTTSQTLLADWDAAGSAATGTRAETLFDTSGFDRHMQQATTSLRPLVVDGPKSGQKALKFDGSYMRALTGITGVTRAVVSAVLRIDATAGVDRPGIISGVGHTSTGTLADFDQTTGAWNTAAPRLSTDTSYASGTVGGSVVATNDSAYTISPGVPFGQWFLMEVEVGVDGQPARVWVDGVAVATINGATTASTLQLAAMMLGGRSHPTRGFVDLAKMSVARVLTHQGARLSTTVAWAQSLYGVAGAPQADTTPPSPPTNVRASRPATGVVRVAWDAAADNVGVSYYDVLGTVAGGNATKVNAQPIPAGTLTYDWAGPFDSNGYFVTVEAVDAAGNRTQAINGASVGAYTNPAGLGYVAQSGAALGNTNSRTVSPSLPATPAQGRYLVSVLAVDKSLGGAVTAPSGGWTIVGTWQGTAGVGLVVAVKTAGVDEPRTVQWQWPGGGGGAAIIAEIAITGASIDGSAVVTGTESAVTTIAANSTAPASGVKLRIAVAGIDSAGDGISPTTWPSTGPAFTNAAQRAFALGPVGGGNVSVALATQVVTDSNPSTISVDSNAADQMAIIVFKVAGTLAGEVAPKAFDSAAFDTTTFDA